MTKKMNKVLVTGSAGFIGFHLVKELLRQNYEVIGIDNLNDYYDQQLKFDRLKNIEEFTNSIGGSERYQFFQLDIINKEDLIALFNEHAFNVVINLAAQAGVRYSLENPDSYTSSNLVGFFNILEMCRKNSIGHLIFASSSSVYGLNSKIPFSTQDNTDYPISLYAATKKSNEIMAHSYSHLFSIPSTGLRFFTVYGPFGRPDMAYYKFTESIDNGDAIDLYNSGNMIRDFTYIDDIINGMMMIVQNPPKIQTQLSTNAKAPFRIYNIGNNKPVKLKILIDAIEKGLGKKAKKNYLGMQPGDVSETFADIDDMVAEFDFSPSISIQEGLKKFIDWYKCYNLLVKKNH
jgi:UDP-glucuronate 4-epimerase